MLSEKSSNNLRTLAANMMTLIVQVAHKNYIASTGGYIAAFEISATINQVESILFISHQQKLSLQFS